MEALHPDSPSMRQTTVVQPGIGGKFKEVEVRTLAILIQIGLY